MENKVIIIGFVAIGFGFFNLQQNLNKVSLSIDSNNAILVALSEKAKQAEAEEKVEKLKNNLKALENTKCAECHVAQSKLLLPMDNKKIDYETFIKKVREGSTFMPSMDHTIISEQRLQKIYNILY